MFLRGKSPALRVSQPDLPALCQALERAGYSLHRGLRTKHDGELEAWVRVFTVDRQVHVQLVAPKRGGDVLVFAHTEPRGYSLKHLLAALFDAVSYSAGARVLNADLDRVRFRKAG